MCGAYVSQCVHDIQRNREGDKENGAHAREGDVREREMSSPSLACAPGRATHDGEQQTMHQKTWNETKKRWRPTRLVVPPMTKSSKKNTAERHRSAHTIRQVFCLKERRRGRGSGRHIKKGKTTERKGREETERERGREREREGERAREIERERERERAREPGAWRSVG
jgi:hypothetical protein